MLGTMENLEENIFYVFSKNKLNNDFKKLLNKKFLEKGLNVKTLFLIYNESIDFDALSKMELQCICDTCYKMGYRELNPLKYFSNEEMIEYDSFILKKQEFTTLEFKYVRRIEDNLYEAWITYKQIYEYYKNRLIIYNKQTQRAPSFKRIGTKNLIVKKATVKKQSVKEIKSSMEGKEYYPDQITLNIRIMDEKIPKFKFKNILDDVIGDITIEPDYDRNSPYHTVVEIIDGFHRFLAAYEAYEKKLSEGEDLEGGLFCRIVLLDLEEAKKAMNQSFKRSDTDKEWLKTLEQDDYTKFIDKLISKNIFLKEKNTRDTFEELKIAGGYTTKMTLVDALRKINIDLSSIAVTSFAIKDINMIIENIVIILRDEFFNKNIDEMKNKSYLLEKNMWAGYLVIANILRTNKEHLTENIIGVCEKLYELIGTSDIEKLKLSNKNFNIVALVAFFTNIAKGVMMENGNE